MADYFDMLWSSSPVNIKKPTDIYDRFLYECTHNNTSVINDILLQKNIDQQKLFMHTDTSISVYPPVIIAIRFRYIKLLHILIKCVPKDILARQILGSERNFSALMHVLHTFHIVPTENMRLIKLLLKKYPTLPQYNELNGISPLMLACTYNNSSLVDMIIKTKYSHPEYVDVNGYTALFYACMHNANDSIIRLLLATNKSRVEHKYTEFTVVHWLCHHCDIIALKLILAVGKIGNKQLYDDMIGMRYENIRQLMFKYFCNTKRDFNMLPYKNMTLYYAKKNGQKMRRLVYSPHMFIF